MSLCTISKIEGERKSRGIINGSFAIHPRNLALESLVCFRSRFISETHSLFKPQTEAPVPNTQA